MGLVIQRNHWPEWFRQIRHSRRDLFCSWYHKYISGVYATQCSGIGIESALFGVDAGTEPTGPDL